MKGSPKLMNGRAAPKTTRHLDAPPDEMCDGRPDCGPGGLLQKAHAALSVLADCHHAAGALRSDLLPPEPAACGEVRDKPQDLQTLLNLIFESAAELNKELTDLNRAVAG